MVESYGIKVDMVNNDMSQKRSPSLWLFDFVCHLLIKVWYGVQILLQVSDKDRNNTSFLATR